MTSIRKETGISLQILKTLQGQSANTVNNCTHNTFDNKLKKNTNYHSSLNMKYICRIAPQILRIFNS